MQYSCILFLHFYQSGIMTTARCFPFGGLNVDTLKDENLYTSHKHYFLYAMLQTSRHIFIPKMYCY